MKPYILSIFLFIFLFLIFGIFDDLPSLLRRGETIPFSRYLLQAPFVFVQLSPLAVLCALLLTFGTLNKYNELFGLRTSGISLYRIILPFLFLGLFISLFSFVVNEKVVPLCNRKLEKRTFQDITLFSPLPDRYLYARQFDSKEGSLTGLRLDLYTNDEDYLTVEAKKGIHLKDKEWSLQNGVIRYYQKERLIKEENFVQKVLSLRFSPQEIYSGSQAPEGISAGKLSRYLKRMRKTGIFPASALTQFHAKFSFPFTNFFILFLALPFLLSSGRKKFIFNIGLAILLSFFYYLIFSAGIALGTGKILPPFLGAWLANLLSFAFGTSFSLTHRL